MDWSWRARLSNLSSNLDVAADISSLVALMDRQLDKKIPDRYDPDLQRYGLNTSSSSAYLFLFFPP